MKSSPHSAVHLAPRQARQVALEFFRELWRYKLVVPVVAGIVVGLVAVYTSRQPKVYEATTTLEYDPNPAKPLGSKIEDSSDTGYLASQEFYETQNYILKSRGLAERVVRRFGLHRDADFMGESAPYTREQMSGVTVEQAAQVLVRRIKVVHILDTRIVRITVEDRSPDRAQLVANGITDEYIQKSLEDHLGTSSRALEWLGGQMGNLKVELEASELALYHFREENQSLSASLEERQKIIAGQLQAYNNTLTGLKTDLLLKQARLTVLREMLAAINDEESLASGPTIQDTVVNDLRARYRSAVLAVNKLSVTYGKNHPQVQVAHAEREATAHQLRGQLQAMISGAEAELRELSRSVTGIQQALNQVNQQGLQLSLQETTYSRLDRERRSKESLYDMVMERAAETDLTRALNVASARVVERALKPFAPVRPQPRFALIVGSILGLMLGVVAAFGVSLLDNKIRGPADLESRGITVLGVLPTVVSGGGSGRRLRKRRGHRAIDADRDLIVHREPRSVAAECCRTIRTNLTFKSADRPLRTLAVTSAVPRDGKTTVAISLAIALAQSGKRALLVDTDMRRPRVHKAFALPALQGLTTILAGEAVLEEVVQMTDVPNLTLLQCGPIPPNPAELLHTKRFSQLIEDARDKYDVVVFDTPPLGAVTDPAIISTLVDGIIVVVRARSTSRVGVAAALRQLRDVSARIVGAVLNDVDLTDSDYGPYYSYYRGYYAEAAKSERPPAGDEAASRT